MKLDENRGQQPLELLLEAGHDAVTVKAQQLSGVDDLKLVAVCKEEKRCLVTLDMGFGNPLVFPPEEYSGIAVLRLLGSAVSRGYSRRMQDARKRP